MDWILYLLVIGAGFFAGVINTIAGGGSLLTLPLLIFTGLPSAEANGTNRVAVLVQSFSSVAGFRKSGIKGFRMSLIPAISASVGAVAGAYYAINIPDELFNMILAIIMVLMAVLLVFKPPRYLQKPVSKNQEWLSGLIFFFIGVYGGMIQAGVGLLMLLFLPFLYQTNLVQANMIKVFVTFVFTIVALLIFAGSGNVNWFMGAVLSVGMALGGWFGSLWTVKMGDIWIRRVLFVMVIIMAVRLWWISM